MAKLTVTLAQMNITLGDVRRNMGRAEEIVAEAARRNSHLVLFPELWTTGYALSQGKELASTLNTGAFAEISSLAMQHKISVIGSMMEKRGSEVANSAAFMAPN